MVRYLPDTFRSLGRSRQAGGALWKEASPAPLRQDAGRYYSLAIACILERCASLSRPAPSPVEYLRLGKYGRNALAFGSVRATLGPPRDRDAFEVRTVNTPPGTHFTIEIAPLGHASGGPSEDVVHFNPPYLMHPAIYHRGLHRRLPDRGGARPIKVLLAGNLTSPIYGDGAGAQRMRDMGLLSRLEVTREIARRGSQVAAEEVRRVATGQLDQRSLPEVAILDTATAALSPSEWLGLLCATEFFVCAPGVNMPVCHNIIEATATGAIPITPYAGWLAPALTDDVNALTFQDRESLAERIEEACRMNETRRSELRRGVIQFYKEHCDIQSLAAVPASAQVRIGIATEATISRRHHRLEDESTVQRAGARPKATPGI